MQQSRSGPRREVFFLILAFLFVLACEKAPTEEPSERAADPTPRSKVRTVVLISLDTLRADHLGMYGHAAFTSPRLDQFALEGVVFEDASSTAPWTLPAHASMLTGLTPSRHGVVSSEAGLSVEVETLADWFNEGGWETSTIVNSLWLSREKYGLTQEFTDYLAVKRSNYKQIGPSTEITDEAIAQLKKQGGDSLFLFIHYYDIHADYAALPAYERLLVGPYEGEADGSAWQLMRANFAPAHIAACIENFEPGRCEYGSQEIPRRIDSNMKAVAFEEDDIAHIKQRYDAGIRQTDTELGRLLSFIDDSEGAAETLVLITSDHGEEFMEHGRVDHFLTMYQETIRVPLLLRGPGVPVAERFDVPVSLIDIAPTLLSLTALPIPEGLEGFDLSTLWRGESELNWESRPLYGEASGGLEYERSTPGVYPVYRSVRMGDLKLIERQMGDEEMTYELFDLLTDPEEKIDLAKSRSADVDRLKGVLEGRANYGGNSPSGPKVEMTPAEIEELRSLGYVP
jgi:arylsulfatase A-like enzyme